MPSDVKQAYKRVNEEDSEAAMIDCSHGNRFGLLLEDIYRLKNPIPAKGAQGIWYSDHEELLAAHDVIDAACRETPPRMDLFERIHAVAYMV